MDKKVTLNPPETISITEELAHKLVASHAESWMKLLPAPEKLQAIVNYLEQTSNQLENYHAELVKQAKKFRRRTNADLKKRGKTLNTLSTSMLRDTQHDLYGITGQLQIITNKIQGIRSY